MPSSPSAQASEQHHSSSYGRLSINTATIRPHESAACSHSQRQSAHSVTSAAEEAARMTPLDIKYDSFMLLPMLGTISSPVLPMRGCLLLCKDHKRAERAQEEAHARRKRLVRPHSIQVTVLLVAVHKRF